MIEVSDDLVVNYCLKLASGHWPVPEALLSDLGSTGPQTSQV